MATINNPLGLQADNQGCLPEFKVISMEGEGQETRFDPCAKFCDFLSNQEHYTQKFDSLSHHLQVLAVIVYEESQQQPNRMKENFLKTTAEFRIIAITQAADSPMLTTIVVQEVELRHIASLLQFLRTLRVANKLVPVPKQRI